MKQGAPAWLSVRVAHGRERKPLPAWTSRGAPSIPLETPGICAGYSRWTASPQGEERVNIPFIEESALRPGDVLLSYEDSHYSNIIRLLDGGRYSHAALFDGDLVVKAGARRIEQIPLHAGIDGWEYVDVYRYHANVWGEQLTSTEAIVRRAHHYLNEGTLYADNQLYLIGLLILLKRTTTFLEKTYLRVAQMPLQAVLKDAYDLYKRISDGKDTKPIGCSELVYRCFYEARPKYRYRLIQDSFHILGAGSVGWRKIGAPLASHGGYALDTDCQDILERFEELFYEQNPLLSFDVNSDVQADMASPYLLEISANLRLVGRLTMAVSKS
jgi:hypothetical protein